MQAALPILHRSADWPIRHQNAAQQSQHIVKLRFGRRVFQSFVNFPNGKRGMAENACRHKHKRSGLFFWGPMRR